MKKIKVQSLQDVKTILSKLGGDFPVSSHLVLFLDDKLYLSSYELLHKGDEDILKEALNKALEEGAKSLILVENIGQGPIDIDQLDAEILVRADHLASILKLKLLDFIIVSQDDLLSYRYEINILNK